ncbi:type VII secretion protein EccCa, partial [Mycobacterium hubeiense]|uniref:type VII secretion protein EccCa n=1 Tax=Mycobacterium hubeiense TaxID=1867256 RepID=UPI000C7EAC8D
AKGRPVTLPGGKHELQSPPEMPRKTPTPIIQFILPVFIIVLLVGMVVMMITMGGGLSGQQRTFNPLYMIMPFFMLLSVLGMASHSIGGGSQIGEVNEDRKDYLRYLGIQRRRVQQTGEAQLKVRKWDNPQAAVLPSLVAPGTGGPDKPSARMWERRSDAVNFAYARVGLGTERLATELKAPETAAVDDLEPVCARALRRFVDTHKAQSGMPLAIALRTYPFISLTDEADGEDAAALMRAMICQLVTFHGPDDLLVAVITEDPDGAQWGWVKWLPHNQHPTLEDSIGSARMVYSDVASAREALTPLISHRGAHNKDTTNSVLQLVIVSDRARAMTAASSLIGRDGVDGVTLIDLRPEDAVSDTLKVPFRLTIAGGLLYAPDERGKQTKFAAPDGVSVQFASDYARLMSRYRPASEMDIIERQVTRKVAKGGLLGYLGISDAAMLDPAVSQRPKALRDFMRPVIGVTPADEPVHLNLKETGQGGTGPHGILIGATGAGKSELLRTLVLSLAVTHSSEELNMLLVDYKGGATFLGFEALPHTSAILTNMEAESHLVDRMDVAIRGEINRRQEIFRATAERPDVHTQVPNIQRYNEIRESGVPIAPMPALFIVVDEFSALLDDNPEFAKLFALIGQQGRSMGIYLLLATQSLRSGRISQVDPHLSYAIALRTNGPQESRDVLGTPDASELPESPGAAYFKPVSGELMRMRAFYTGDAYVPPKRAAVAAPNAAAAPAVERPRPRLLTASPVVAVAPDLGAGRGVGQPPRPADGNGHGPVDPSRVLPAPNGGPVAGVAFDGGGVVAEYQPAVGVSAAVPAAPAAAGAGAESAASAAPAVPGGGVLTGVNVKTEAQVLIDRMAGHGLEAHRIWLPPLDYSHTVHDLLTDANLFWPVRPGPGRIPIGTIDNPFYQRRDAVVIDLLAKNVAVVGSGSAGRSTVLQTLIMSAAHSHSSTEMQFYCLDFSNAKLVALADLAHVGSVATRNEAAKVSRTIAEMSAIMRRREKLFIEHNIMGMADFRRRKAQKEPALRSDRHGDVVLVIDGWTTITKDESAGFDHLENAVTLLAARGKSFGVHVVIATSRYADFKPAIKDELGQHVELRLNDPTTSEVSRKKAENVPDKPGRGMVKSTRPRSGDVYNPEVLDLLIALPIVTPGMRPQPLSTEIDVDVHESVAQINSVNPGAAPRVRLLPNEQPREEFMSMVPELAPPPPNRAQLLVPLGVGEVELEPKYIDFNDDTQTHFVVIADRVSGKTTVLRHIVTTLIEQNDPNGVRFLIVDFHRGLLGVLPSDDYGVTATNPEELRQHVEVLAASLPARMPPSKITPAQLRRRDWWQGQPDIFVIVDNAHELAGGGGRLDQLQPLMPFLARGRDLGFHMVAAYRSGGVSRYLYGPGLLGELKNLNTPGIVMSGPKDEGPLIDTVRASAQPPGRGMLVTRDFTELVQVPNLPAPDDE